MDAIAVYRRRIARSLEGCRFKCSLRLCLFEEGYSFSLFGFLIALPFLDRYAYEPHEMMEAWGFYCEWDALVLCWGDWVKFVHMPWELRHVKSEVMRPDGKWTKRVASYEDGGPDGRRLWVMPYRYTLRSGEVQERTATVYMERVEWRQRWLKWLPLFAKVRKSIWMDFDGEVGERTGSWKGGTVGCGYNLLPKETVEQAVRRMERERVFN